MTRSDETLATIRQPIAAACGLPNQHYIDPDVHRQEREALLFATWAGVGVAAQVPEPGDVEPVDFAGVPLLLVRGRDGTVRVFQNVCRHRGMRLVAEKRRIGGALRCPYHSWCYGLDGRLVATPHVGGPGHNVHPAIDRSDLGLLQVRCHVWRDVVWIDFSGTAPPFDEAMGPVISRLAEFEQPLYHGGGESHFALDVACNWKLAVENYCESYHLPWVHPGLNSYSRLEDHYSIELPGVSSGQGTRVYRPAEDGGNAAFPEFPGLSEKWQTAAEYLAVYPNVLIGVHRDHAFAIVLLPQGVESTLELVHLYYASPETDPAMRSRNAELWKGVFVEDIFVVEGMQKGRHAPGFDGGRFSPVMESATHCFHRWAAERLSMHSVQ